jgi:hypothetical protein
MSRLIVALCLLLAAQEANAACRSTGNRAGCTTPNGAATYNKNTGEVHRTQSDNDDRSNQVAPGTSKEGRRGNSATKAAQQGCAFVNGERVCR